jgi:hypothetical protein
MGNRPTLRINMGCVSKIIIILILILTSSSIYAETYSWQDQDGNLHFTDDPAKIPKNSQSDVKVSESITGMPQNIPQNGVEPKPKSKVLKHVRKRVQEPPDTSVEPNKGTEEELDKVALDNELKNLWNQMKSALTARDIERAVSYFSMSTKAAYRSQFRSVSRQLPKIVADMGEIRMVSATSRHAIYDLRTIREGQVYSFQLEFVRDYDGAWKIYNY